MNWIELTSVLTRPIAFHRIFATIGGGACAGLFLSQTFYWTTKTKDPDGWFYKSQIEWEEETALTRYEQESVRKKLKDKKLIEEKKAGIPCRLYYRINKKNFLDAIADAIKPETQLNRQFGENPQTSSGGTNIQDLKKTANKTKEKPQSFYITETTPETTSEITLSQNERESFEKFVRNNWPKEIHSMRAFLADKAYFDEWYGKFLSSSAGKAAKQEAIAAQYDWINDPRFEEWLPRAFEEGVAWAQENEAELDERSAFLEWAQATDPYKGRLY